MPETSSRSRKYEPGGLFCSQGGIGGADEVHRAAGLARQAEALGAGAHPVVADLEDSRAHPAGGLPGVPPEGQLILDPLVERARSRRRVAGSRGSERRRREPAASAASRLRSCRTLSYPPSATEQAWPCPQATAVTAGTSQLVVHWPSSWTRIVSLGLRGIV